MDAFGREVEGGVGLRVLVDVDEGHYEGLVGTLGFVLYALQVGADGDVGGFVGGEWAGWRAWGWRGLVGLLQYALQDLAQDVDVV